jgi:hypothetical protein
VVMFNSKAQKCMCLCPGVDCATRVDRGRRLRNGRG